MNLEIQLAWCRHWIREQMGIPANGSIVVFIEDRRTSDGPMPRSVLETVRAVAIEARWQFSNPQCVFISVVSGSNHLKNRFETSLYGVIDQQISVDNATDLCGWIGASNSVFVLDPGPTRSSNTRLHTHLQIDSETTLQQAVAQVGRGFQKPWNFIDKTNPQLSLEKLNWECMHQPAATHKTSESHHASIPFSEAVSLLEPVFRNREASTNRSLNEKNGFRQAG